MDIGLKRRTVSTGIPTAKIYPLICCYTFPIIIKCCYGNMNRQTCIHKHVLQQRNPPSKSFLENEMRKLGANQKLKAGIFCVLESGICSGRIRNSAPGIRNPQRGIQNLFEQTDLRVTGFYEYFDVNIYLHNRKLTQFNLDGFIDTCKC